MARIYEIARPLAFTTAKGPTLRWYRDVLPVAFGVMAVVAYLALPVDLKLTGTDSVSAVMAPLFAGLPGFFIAALAAVATFQGGDLDREMSDTTIWISQNGDGKDTKVTLRVFLCHLFAYLTLLALVGFFICAVATLLAPNIVQLDSLILASKTGWDDTLMEAAKSLFVLASAVLTGSVVSCTALGLYFLAERIHQEL